MKRHRGRPLAGRVSRLTLMLLAVLVWLLTPTHASGQTRIVALSPEKGPTDGGTVVTLEVEGIGTLGPVRVEFGNRPATAVRELGPSTVEAVTPPGDPGPVPVRVVSGLWRSRSNPAVFTYVLPAPRVARLDPSPMRPGTEELVLAVEGEHFTPTCTAVVDGVPVPTTFVSSQRLLARISASLLATPGHKEIRVTDTVGESTSNVVSLNVVSPPSSEPVTLPSPATLAPPPPVTVAPPPKVTAVEVPPLRAGDSAAMLTVRGRDFRPDSVIQLAGTAVPTEHRTGEELAARIPKELLAKAGDLSGAVLTPGPGGGTSSPFTLSVGAPFPGRFLVFTSSRRGRRNHIFLLDRETGRLDPLEEANSASGSDGYPSISADGRFIVFQSDRNGGQADIFLFDRETRTLDPLPEVNHPTAFDGFPHISANGRFIVFESDRLNRKPKIFLFDRQTRTVSELSQANEAAADDGLAAISN